MIGSSRLVRVWACAGPTDLRKGFDSLVAVVQQQLRLDPLSGDCFLFVSKDRRAAKVLTWDGTGLCIYQKRLGRGRFAALWVSAGATTVKLTTTELALFLEGANLRGRLPLSPAQICVGKTRQGSEPGIPG
jgi:transposase